MITRIPEIDLQLMNDETTKIAEDDMLEADPTDKSNGETSKVRPAEQAKLHTKRIHLTIKRKDDEE